MPGDPITLVQGLDFVAVSFGPFASLISIVCLLAVFSELFYCLGRRVIYYVVGFHLLLFSVGLTCVAYLLVLFNILVRYQIYIKRGYELAPRHQKKAGKYRRADLARFRMGCFARRDG